MLDSIANVVYNGHTMKRVTYHLTEQQIEKLRVHSQETGLSVAEIVRRAIDVYLESSDSRRFPSVKDK